MYGLRLFDVYWRWTACLSQGSWVRRVSITLTTVPSMLVRMEAGVSTASTPTTATATNIGPVMHFILHNNKHKMQYIFCMHLTCDLWPLPPSGQYCTEDVDECELSPNACQNGGTCHNTIGGFHCVCVNGWTGDDCSENIDDCASAACSQGATCHDRVASFFCECPHGRTGTSVWAVSMAFSY